MEFILMLMFLGFLISVNIYGERKPILYLLNAILVLIISALDFTSNGHNWVNNFWGTMMFLFAMYWGNLYFKHRH